ncbi:MULTISPECIES: heavy metal-binding domain-containing protein [unclassified Arcicella]|uniref:heavy metal-binding domain-containing protein n=1 Tax=unclassified Arcicella TaxID=2644986 RepID=UPI00285A26EA|nr:MULTISPECIES: heavy metal-binding domain-containing protein [unclassified Arcicella]MDR6563735.1 hypothetical protein [Arcicella sp. BE51]MDR6813581.1 hypothetical protein [Arcicella sp. BE140]MDR6824893.1 hypothetical protein [Arcicella sp. BE139]
MKSIQILATFCLIVAVSTSNVFAQKAKGKAKIKKEVTSAVYACSMHPNMTGKKGDKCPTCGMALVPKKAEAKKEVAAVAYICPMKCEGSASDKPGDCPKCGMKLVAATEKKDEHSGHNHK